jgi:Protein of unknown function (DUF3253)
MNATRAVAVQLAEAGRIEILQKGAVVEPSSFKGPIRLRLAGDGIATEEDSAGSGGSTAAQEKAGGDAVSS